MGLKQMNLSMRTPTVSLLYSDGRKTESFVCLELWARCRTALQAVLVVRQPAVCPVLSVCEQLAPQLIWRQRRTTNALQRKQSPSLQRGAAVATAPRRQGGGTATEFRHKKNNNNFIVSHPQCRGSADLHAFLISQFQISKFWRKVVCVSINF